MEKIKKQIHLPNTIVKSLEKIAASSVKTPKKYIEELIIKKTKAQLTWIKRNSNGH